MPCPSALGRRAATLLDTLGCAPHQLTPVDTDSAVCMLHAAALCRHEGE